MATVDPQKVGKGAPRSGKCPSCGACKECGAQPITVYPQIPYVPYVPPANPYPYRPYPHTTWISNTNVAQSPQGISDQTFNS